MVVVRSSLVFSSVFQTKIPGVGFLKIHAPWEVLCREAEFMKLKMPTIKVCAFDSYTIVILSMCLSVNSTTDVSLSEI